MPILILQAEFEGPARDLFRALGDLTRTLGHSTFQNLEARSPLNVQIVSDEQAHQSEHEVLMAVKIRELGVRPQVHNRLAKFGMETVGDVVTKNPDELLAIPNFGKVSLAELVGALEDRGLSLRP